MGYVVYTWVSSLIKEWGYVGYRGPGLYIGFGLFFVGVLSVAAIDIFMALMNLNKIIRSAIWFSAILGPYMSVMVLEKWGIPVWSHIAGSVSVLLAFSLSWLLDRLLKRD